MPQMLRHCQPPLMTSQHLYSLIRTSPVSEGAALKRASHMSARPMGKQGQYGRICSAGRSIFEVRYVKRQSSQLIEVRACFSRRERKTLPIPRIHVEIIKNHIIDVPVVELPSQL